MEALSNVARFWSRDSRFGKRSGASWDIVQIELVVKNMAQYQCMAMFCLHHVPYILLSRVCLSMMMMHQVTRLDTHSSPAMVTVQTRAWHLQGVTLEQQCG